MNGWKQVAATGDSNDCCPRTKRGMSVGLGWCLSKGA